MGLKDRVKSSLRKVWSPITVLFDREQMDNLVTSGGRAKVQLLVEGEDDGTAERVELRLERTGQSSEKVTWPLGELPATVGTHTAEVELPAGLKPSCGDYMAYAFAAELHRTAGMGSTSLAIVDVVGAPEQAYVPEGPRSGQDEIRRARIQIALDPDSADSGGTVTGTVTVAANEALKSADLDVRLAVTVESEQVGAGKLKPVADTRVADGLALAAGETRALPFSLDVPPNVPPSLDNDGKVLIHWQVRAELGKDTAWARVAMLDPEAGAGIRDRPGQSLLDWLVSLDSNPGYN